MESNALLAHELHKKFEDLNEEISTALRHQQDALNLNARSNSSSNGSGAGGVHTKKDVLRLARLALDWREDVTALSKHIELQLQHSRALRGHEAHGLLSTSAASQKQQEDHESAKVRCLRSDLRLLLDFRVSLFQRKSAKEPASAHTLLSAAEAETKQLTDFLEKSVRKEKTGGKDALIVELFEMRRELASKISEDVLKEKQQLDMEHGAQDISAPGSGLERDLLASYDTQLFISNLPPPHTLGSAILQTLVDLQHEIRERLASKNRHNGGGTASGTHAAGAVELNAHFLGDAPARAAGFGATQQDSRAAAAPSGSSDGMNISKANALLDDAHLAIQKLKRELAELKAANSKLTLANSQLEDDITHLQRCYDDEKRAHLSGKKLHIPKIQKLEEAMLTTAKAFEELQLSVDLITNMYKSLMQTLATQQQGEDDLKKERDRVALLLSAEIKKIAALTKENERKDKLVTLAMAARFEMIQVASRSEKVASELRDQRDHLEVRAKDAEDETAVLKVQLDSVYARLDAAETASASASARIVQLESELGACIEAAGTREHELQVKCERDLMVLQSKFDKTKRELLDAMSQNLNLDGRLKKAQDKITRMANIGAGAAGSS